MSGSHGKSTLTTKWLPISEWEFLLFHHISSTDIISVPDFGHSNRCILVSHHCFNLHFPDDIWCKASLQIICHMFIFFVHLPFLFSYERRISLLEWEMLLGQQAGSRESQTCTSFFVSCLLRSSSHFSVRLFVFLLLSFKSFCISWVTIFYQICLFKKLLFNLI